MRPRNLKFSLYINRYGYSMQAKFYVPRSHSFREKCNYILKLASHISPILCHRGTLNFFCILTHMDTLCKPNFMFLGHTVFEKNAMITWNYHRTFLRYCKTEEFEIFFCILTHMDTLCKPNFMFLGDTVFEKKAMITCKNSKLHIRPDKQLWNFKSYHRIFLRYCATEEL